MFRKYENEFRESIDKLQFTYDEKEKIRDGIMHPRYKVTEREERTMKRVMLRRVAVIAAACVMVTGVTAFAGGIISTYTSSSHEYYDYESVDEINEKAEGEIIAFPEAFDNGFVFDGGNDVNVNGLDDSGVKQEEWHDLHAVYKNADEESVTLAVSDRGSEEKWREATETRIINGIKVDYNYDEYLSLPDESYELDEATKERMESDDHFFVGYGSDAEETHFFKGVLFIKDGKLYDLYSMDDVSSDELFSMAEELIG